MKEEVLKEKQTEVCTECVHCPKKFKGLGHFEEYAQHIIDKHPNDTIRVAWAHEVLGHNEPKPGETPQEASVEVASEASKQIEKPKKGEPRPKLTGED